jgi:hypothetical protein
VAVGELVEGVFKLSWLILYINLTGSQSAIWSNVTLSYVCKGVSETVEQLNW